MLPTSVTYQFITEGRHEFQWKIELGDGTVFGDEYIVHKIGSADCSPRIVRQMFPNGEPSVGNCISAEFTATLLLRSSRIPRYSKIIPYFMAVSDTGLASDWYQAGEFFIDSRYYDQETETLLIKCYDAMLKADGAGGSTYYELSSISTWPSPASDVVEDIAQLIGVTIDSRTSIESGFMVKDPGNLNPREVLGYIGAEHAGNWCITHLGQLRLVPICGSDATTIPLGLNEESLTVGNTYPVYKKFLLVKDNATSYSKSGEGSGITLSAESPWATQTKANYGYSVISGLYYQPFSANSAFVDPAAELGDRVSFTVSGHTIRSYLWTSDLTCSEHATSSISAPGGDELNHEYPYINISKRRMRHIEDEMDDLEEEILEEVDSRISSSMVSYLYADQGDISELTVDELSTSRRVLKYNLQDTTDDNYIKIKGQFLRFMTGTVTSITPVQAKNRKNQNLYWQRQPTGHDADGHPYDSEGQIPAGVQVTNWPVYTYTYTEMVKTELAFNLEGANYVPMLTMGAGDENGRTKAILHKKASGFDISFVDTQGREQGLTMNSAGYMDIYGLRKPTGLFFGGWDSGYFTVVLDGGQVNNYLVNFDYRGYPISIIDGDGHETVVSW